MIELKIMTIEDALDGIFDVSGDVAEAGMGAEILIAPTYKIEDLNYNVKFLDRGNLRITFRSVILFLGRSTQPVLSGLIWMLRRQARANTNSRVRSGDRPGRSDPCPMPMTHRNF